MTRDWGDQPWVRPYRRAVVELDPDKLPERIKIAEQAIQARLAELGDSGDILATHRK
jgi:hypothetical protein